LIRLFLVQFPAPPAPDWLWTEALKILLAVLLLWMLQQMMLETMPCAQHSIALTTHFLLQGILFTLVYNPED